MGYRTRLAQISITEKIVWWNSKDSTFYRHKCTQVSMLELLHCAQNHAGPHSNGAEGAFIWESWYSKQYKGLVYRTGTLLLHSSKDYSPGSLYPLPFAVSGAFPCLHICLKRATLPSISCLPAPPALPVLLTWAPRPVGDVTHICRSQKINVICKRQLKSWQLPFYEFTLLSHVQARKLTHAVPPRPPACVPRKNPHTTRYRVPILAASTCTDPHLRHTSGLKLLEPHKGVGCQYWMTLCSSFGTVAKTAFCKTTAGLGLTLSKSNLPWPFTPSLSLALPPHSPIQLCSPAALEALCCGCLPEKAPQTLSL